MATPTEKLYGLLPSVYRERDAAEGYPLRALLSIIAGQAALVEADIERLYNDLFIETCQPWVIPYIGDLVGNNPLYDFSRNEAPDTAHSLFPDLRGKDLRPPIAARLRADVAKTIYYRRRKGTLPMLEELARDVTGWPAHAVEFFELLGWHQHLEHLRFQSRWADIRSVERADRVGGPFDETSHTVDVRQINQLDGWHNIHNVGFFLWRLRSYPLKRVPARRAAGGNWRYHFSPLGQRAPLFSRLRREGDEAGLATELHVPGPIRSAFFYEDLVRFNSIPPAERPDFTDLYGMFDPVTGVTLTPCPDCSLFVFLNGLPVPPGQIVCRRLNPWPAAQPTGAVVAIDVEAGRLAVGSGLAPGATGPDVFYHYGFSADMGGGPYERQKWLTRPDLPQLSLEVREDGGGGAHASLTSALTAWQAAGRPNTVVTILDSRTYALPAAVELNNENWLIIEAANGERPLLQTQASGLEVKVKPPAVAGDPDRNAEFTLSGVVVEGFVNITGDLARFRLLHSTLVPGRKLNEDGNPATKRTSLAATAFDGSPPKPLNAQLRVEIAFSITGEILVPEHVDAVRILDSIVEGVGGTAVSAIVGNSGPPVEVERSTLIGQLRAKTLNASETIFTQTVETTRTQAGCVRFSFVAPGSRTPRRYRCQPDLAVEKAIAEALKARPGLTTAEKGQIRTFTEGWLAPSFTAARYGQPAYAQLHLACPEEIRTGAEDGSEMGAFCHLKQPQRESNLRIRLQEYLPFGLQAGIIYTT